MANDSDLQATGEGRDQVLPGGQEVIDVVVDLNVIMRQLAYLINNGQVRAAVFIECQADGWFQWLTLRF